MGEGGGGDTIYIPGGLVVFRRSVGEGGGGDTTH